MSYLGDTIMDRNSHKIAREQRFQSSVDRMYARITQAHDRLLYAMLAFAAERELGRLMEKIADYAKNITLAEAAMLYVVDDDERLNFAVVRSEVLRYACTDPGSEGEFLPGLPLRDSDTGLGNHHNVVSHVALSGCTVAIDDVYQPSGFDFDETRYIDAVTESRTKSMLVLPLKDYHGDTVAVLQLMNARDPDCGEIVPFPPYLVKVMEALAVQAGVSYDNHKLVDAQKALFESFAQSIAHAIDAKSPHTSGHCQRVPVLHEMLAEAACKTDRGPFAEFDLNQDEKYELRLAAWMHDCGKIAVPEYIMDKSTKLEGLRDGIEEVATRIEVVKRELEIKYLERVMVEPDRAADLRQELIDKTAAMDSNRDFLRNLNQPTERPDAVTLRRLRAIAAIDWTDWSGKTVKLLSGTELENLAIPQGTLNDSERRVVRSHIDITLQMLEGLKLPKGLKNVPEIAGSHHEHMDGTGYPRRLHGDEMSIPARMLAVADVFEALTANDRPYKHSKTLSESLDIMASMRDDNHIDSDLFNLFLDSGIWLTYADRYMAPELIDNVDITRYRRPDDEPRYEDQLVLAAE